jgi:antitoxin HicB
MKIAYPYTTDKQKDGRYLVRFGDLPEAFTEGESLDEAAFNASEVLNLVLEQLLADNADIPQPSAAKGHPIAVPEARIQAALQFNWGLKDSGKTVADIARELGTSWASAQRLQDPKHTPSVRQLERAAKALGKRLLVQFV